MSISKLIATLKETMDREGDIQVYYDAPADASPGRDFQLPCGQVEIRTGTNFNGKTEKVEIVKIVVIK